MGKAGRHDVWHSRNGQHDRHHTPAIAAPVASPWTQTIASINTRAHHPGTTLPEKHSLNQRRLIQRPHGPLRHHIIGGKQSHTRLSIGLRQTDHLRRNPRGHRMTACPVMVMMMRCVRALVIAGDRRVLSAAAMVRVLLVAAIMLLHMRGAAWRHACPPLAQQAEEHHGKH